MKPTEPDFSTFYDDALAFLKYGIDNKKSLEWILTTLVHDIAGIVRKEVCFVPQVSGWAKSMKAQKKAKKRGKK
jgi:hypothetical protein